jgi:2-keto-4-pentenoate hydratase
MQESNFFLLITTKRRNSAAFKRKLLKLVKQPGAPVDAAALNHPATGVAWLANKIAPYGEQLHAGDIVLAGSFTSPTPAVQGDTFHADYGPLGSISFHFV